MESTKSKIMDTSPLALYLRSNSISSKEKNPLLKELTAITY
jgi:hypothetical protein